MKKMKKMVVMMDAYDERSMGRILRTVADFDGVASITMDPKDGKLTVTGDFDCSKIFTKLKKKWNRADMATFGPYDPKKEAETAAEKKRMEERERERERLEALNRRNHFLYGPPTPYQICVCNHDPYPGCIIS